MVFSHIPPTQDALLQHVKRAAFQAGFVRAQSMVEWQSLPSPSDWAWQCVDNVWHPVWMTASCGRLLPWIGVKQDAQRSDASGSVQTCPVQLCVIVRENVTEKMTLNSLLDDYWLVKPTTLLRMFFKIFFFCFYVFVFVWQEHQTDVLMFLSYFTFY